MTDDRDIPEEMVEKATQALRDAGFVDPDDDTVPTFAASEDVSKYSSRFDVWVPARDAVIAVLSAALAGRQVVDLPAEPVDELAARVLDEHLLTGPRPGQCRCGWGDGRDVRTLGRSHSKHVVEQLRAAGVLAGAAEG